MKAINIVELDVDYCSRTYGVAPCNAVTGSNMFFYSADFNPAGWGGTNATITPAQTTGPFGANNGARVQKSNVQGWMGQGASPVTPNVPHTFSMFAKVSALPARYLVMIFQNSGAPFCRSWVNFDLLTGTISSPVTFTGPYSGVSAGIFPAGNGWFRCVLTTTLAAHGSAELYFSINANNTTLDGADSVANSQAFVFGPQLEQASAPSHYRATPTGPLTTGQTGTRKCMNTRATCQDIANYNDVGATIRFAENADYLPLEIELIPNISDIAFTPGMVSLGENLGQRSSLTVTFNDHKHSDTGTGFDKYINERTYVPFNQGSFWGKFRARHPFLQGRALRLVRGAVPDITIAEMDSRHYVIDTINGPAADGKFQIIAKDLLKLADGDKSQAPAINTGRLAVDITAAATVLRAVPSGVGQAEYPASGFLNIGGKEIVSYNRLPDATLLIHADGVPASPLVDAAGGRTITKGGNSTITNVAGNIKFGTGAMTFDGADDSVFVAGTADPDLAFGAGDFTIALWYKPATAGAANYQVFDWRFNLADVAPQLTQDGGNTFTYYIGTSAKIVSSTFTPAAAYFHIALTRSGLTTRLFLNGNVIGSYTPAANEILVCGNNRPLFGLRTDSAFDFSGFMDEIYVVKGRADWVANFTPPAVPYGTALGDNFQIVRAQKNTQAETHSADERLQEVLSYAGQDPANIINDLLVTYARVPAGYVPLSSWLLETQNYLGTVYTADIAEPTDVDKLISELIEQAALALWWDDKAKILKLQVLRAIPLSADRINDDVRIANSLTVKEQPEKRISRVLVYFGQINPLLQLDQLENYRSSVLRIDDASEANYGGTQSLKKIYSRWIPFGGRTIADRICSIFTNRYRNAPRLVSYKLLKGNVADPSLGGGYQLDAYPFQDDTGARADLPVEVTRLNVDDAEISVEAEEMRFVTVTTIDHLIVLDANTNNMNLRTHHDLLFGAPHAGDIVTLIIQQGVIIGSNDIGTPALNIGSWPAGVTVRLQGNGRIQGKGGDGAWSTFTINPPEPGGIALYSRYMVQINMTAGAQIWGGGGGGGLGQNGGGGGGAGTAPGDGGIANYNGISPAGAGGTSEVGGDGGATDAANFGGKGGGPGLPGASGTWFASGFAPGGAAGRGIDGLNYTTISGISPDIRGPQVNG